ncbi:MAG: hypothetical protein GC181_13380 [Bacteroidetes bacterium]|nr:hypothetical protein [Bacteroidota bacterium]
MKQLIVWVFGLISFLPANAKTLRVGTSETYHQIDGALSVAKPGDTVFVVKGTYTHIEYLTGYSGNADNWLVLFADPSGDVIFKCGTEAWHLSDVAYLKISGFIFQEQTGNGVNIDDDGTFETPSHHIVLQNCTFRNINATGNNDLLKLSGLDDFQISGCTFLNGSAGGSGIDMVGCHRGIIEGNRWENMGSNCIQAKGGTAYLLIQRNYFKNGGQRTLNLGGSTGLQFFRPDTAEYEAAYIAVYANVIIGSLASVSFTGCVYVTVANNTIYHPEKWVIRILQETVDESRFLPCGNSQFINNVVVMNADVSTEVNIGPNTAPNTFQFANNLWFHDNNKAWGGPTLPTTESHAVIQMVPQFKDISNEDFHLLESSPAIAAGIKVQDLTTDFDGNQYAFTPSIGAFEGGNSSVKNELTDLISIWPNPSNGDLYIDYPKNSLTDLHFYNIRGEEIFPEWISTANGIHLRFQNLSGFIIINGETSGKLFSKKILVIP